MGCNTLICLLDNVFDKLVQFQYRSVSIIIAEIYLGKIAHRLPRLLVFETRQRWCQCHPDIFRRFFRYICCFRRGEPLISNEKCSAVVKFVFGVLVFVCCIVGAIKTATSHLKKALLTVAGLCLEKIILPIYELVISPICSKIYSPQRRSRLRAGAERIAVVVVVIVTMTTTVRIRREQFSYKSEILSVSYIKTVFKFLFESDFREVIAFYFSIKSSNIPYLYEQ